MRAEGLVFRGLGAHLQTLGLQLLQPDKPLTHPRVSEFDGGKQQPQCTGAVRD